MDKLDYKQQITNLEVELANQKIKKSNILDLFKSYVAWHKPKRKDLEKRIAELETKLIEKDRIIKDLNALYRERVSL